jgi:SAM-dependent methyltransferase
MTPRPGLLGSEASGVDGRAEVLASTGCIQYRPDWLVHYESAFDPEDAALKRAEAERLEAALRDRGRWGRIGGVLDVGTCTGRYPLLLREAVLPDGSILGIDIDPACVEFARGNVARVAGSDARIAVVHADFMASELALPQAPFDLVLCMMSTLSYFGRDRRAGFDDALQRVLVRFAHLLMPEGLLFFSIWSREALDAGRVLSIYDESDRWKLAAWTPDVDEVEQRLAAAGFAFRKRSHPDPRLDFWACAKADG